MIREKPTVRISARASWRASRFTRKYYVYRSRSKPRRTACGRREARGKEAAREEEREGGREKERSNEEEREAEEKEENKRTRRSTCDLREREKPRIPPERTDKEDLEPDWMLIDPVGRSFADHTTIRSDVFGNEPIRLVRSFLGLL